MNGMTKIAALGRIFIFRLEKYNINYIINQIFIKPVAEISFPFHTSINAIVVILCVLCAKLI
jgi:hypothetical protein